MQILAPLVYYGFNAMIISIMAWALLSWFRPNPANPLVRILNTIVEPILLPFQKLLPPVGGVSFSAIGAIIVLELIQHAILKALQG